MKIPSSKGIGTLVGKKANTACFMAESKTFLPVSSSGPAGSPHGCSSLSHIPHPTHQKVLSAVPHICWSPTIIPLRGYCGPLAQPPPSLAGLPAPSLPLAAHSPHSSQSKPPPAQNPAEPPFAQRDNQVLVVASRPLACGLRDHHPLLIPLAMLAALPMWPKDPHLLLPRSPCTGCSGCLECFSHEDSFTALKFVLRQRAARCRGKSRDGSHTAWVQVPFLLLASYLTLRVLLCLLHLSSAICKMGIILTFAHRVIMMME